MIMKLFFTLLFLASMPLQAIAQSVGGQGDASAASGVYARGSDGGFYEGDYSTSPAIRLRATGAGLSALQTYNGAAWQTALSLDGATASSITGLSLTSKVSGSGVELKALGGTHEPLLLTSKGTSAVRAQNASSVTTGATGEYTLGIKNTTNLANNLSAISFLNSNSNTVAQVYATNESQSASTGSLHFFTGVAGTLTQAFEISSASVAKFYGGITVAPFASAGIVVNNSSGVLSSSTALTGLTSVVVASGYDGLYPTPKKVSGYYYFGGIVGSSITATNTTPMANDTLYCIMSVADAPFTIDTVSFQTSSSNASVGASVKTCVYAGDGANDAPSTLLGSTAAGTSIADSAVSTRTTVALDAAASINTKIFYMCHLQTSSTGIRTTIFGTSTTYSQLAGGTSTANIYSSGAPRYGYTMAQSYASGCPTPFSASPTVLNTIGLSTMFTYHVQ